MNPELRHNGCKPQGFTGAIFAFLFTMMLILSGFTNVLHAQSAPRGAMGAQSGTINAETWEALGQGLDAPANAMVTVGDYLYLAGGFETANGNAAIRFARFKHTNDT